jgi:hypothetical protein
MAGNPLKVVIFTSVPPRHDVLKSLALKADVVGADLIVAAIRDFANGTVTETPLAGPSKLFQSVR